MEHWLTTIPPLLVYLVTGAVVGLESLGVPLPGEVILVSAAVLTAKNGSHISPHGVALAAFAGAVVGDSIGYVVGRRYGHRLFDWLESKFPHHVNEDVVAYAEHVFDRWGMLAVFFGRFVALLRIFAGPLSGSLHMHYPRFLIANAAGALAWGAGTAYLVYYAGRAAERYLKDFSYVGLVVAVIAGVLASTVLKRRMAHNVEAFKASRAADGEVDAA